MENEVRRGGIASVKSPRFELLSLACAGGDGGPSDHCGRARI